MNQAFAMVPDFGTRCLCGGCGCRRGKRAREKVGAALALPWRPWPLSPERDPDPRRPYIHSAVYIQHQPQPTVAAMALRAAEWHRLPTSLTELCIDTTLRCGQSFRYFIHAFAARGPPPV